MQRLSSEAVLNKLTMITLGIGIFLLGVIFIGLPIPGSPVLGELLAIAAIIEIARGAISLGKENTPYKIIYYASGVLSFIYAIIFTLEFIILLSYIGFGYDITSLIGSSLNANILGKELIEILFIFSYVLIAIYIVKIYFLGKDLADSNISRNSFYLIALIAFLLFIQLTFQAISSVDGYLRPLLIYILYQLNSSNYLYLGIGIALLVISLYAIIKVYNALGNVIQKEYKKKFNLPY